MKYLRFQDRSRLLAFVAYVCRGRFEQLAGLEFHELADDGLDVLALPEERVADLLHTTLDHFGAAPATGSFDSGGVPFQELHAQLDLEVTGTRAPAECLLVLPQSQRGPMQTADVNELVRELAEQDAFRPALWPARFTAGAGEAALLFRLDARLRLASPHDLELRGRPYVLALDADGTGFVPLGHRHPLAGSYGFLFPPLQPGVFRGWFPVVDGERVRWRMRHFKPDLPDPLPLLRSVELNALAGVGRVTLAPTNPDIRVGLEVGPDRRSEEPTTRRVRHLHRFSSSSGILGPRILQLLDQVEAGAQDLAYYHGTVAGDPDSGVQHFVLETRLREEHDEFVPAGERVYVQPEEFERRGLPVFLLRGASFRPNLALLLDSLTDETAFVSELRQRLGLDGDPEALAVIEPGLSPVHPRVLILAHGRPLTEAVRFTLDHFHAGRITTAIEAAEVDFEARVETSHAFLDDLAKGECDQVEYETRSFLAALGVLCDELEPVLANLEKRVAVAQTLVRDAAERFDGSRTQWNEFVDALLELGAHLAEKRYECLADFRIEERKLELALLGREMRALVLQNWCRERYEALVELKSTLDQRCDAIEALGKDIEQQIQVSAELGARVTKLHGEAEERHSKWEARLDELQRNLQQGIASAQARSKRLSTRERRLDAQRAELEQEDERLGALEQDLEAREQELEERKRVSAARARTLQERAEGLPARRQRTTSSDLEEDSEEPVGFLQKLLGPFRGRAGGRGALRGTQIQDPADDEVVPRPRPTSVGKSARSKERRNS